MLPNFDNEALMTQLGGARAGGAPVSGKMPVREAPVPAEDATVPGFGQASPVDPNALTPKPMPAPPVGGAGIGALAGMLQPPTAPPKAPPPTMGAALGAVQPRPMPQQAPRRNPLGGALASLFGRRR
jgi:hypothetical protein